MISFLRRHRFACLLILAMLITHAYAAFSPAGSVMSWFNSDDAFYYFKTAQNISEGYGITFDRLGREGGFHPLWMAVLTPIFALARFDLILPLRLVIVLSGLINAVTGLIIYHLLRRVTRAEVAGLAAYFFCFFPYIHSSIAQLGLESGISAMFLALLLLVSAQANENPSPRRYLLAGGVAILTVLARLDNIFVVLVTGAWLVFRPGQRGWAAARRLLLSDGALITLGVLVAYMKRVGFGPIYAGVVQSEYVMLVLALALRVGLAYLLGLYAPPQPGKWLRYAVRAVLSWGLATFGLAAILLSLSALKILNGFPRMVLAYEAGYALLALVLPRVLVLLLQRTDSPAEKIGLNTFFTRLGAYFAPVGVGLIAYMLFYQVYFSTFMPVSGQVKRWWGTLPNPVYGKPVHDLPGLLGSFGRGGPWNLSQAVLLGPFASYETTLAQVLTVLWTVAMVVLIAFVIYKQRHKLVDGFARLSLAPLAVGCFLHVISYTGTGYLHMRSWYWHSQILLITLLLALLLDAAVTQQSRVPRAAWLPAWANLRLASLAGGAILVAMLAASLLNHLPYRGGTMAELYYLYGIDSLEEATEPGAVIGSTGGGVIGYLVRDRTIVNMDGLMNTKAYFDRLQAGTAAQYLDGIGLNYVFCGEYVITSSDPYFQFKNRLEKLGRFGGAVLFRWVREEESGN